MFRFPIRHPDMDDVCRQLARGVNTDQFAGPVHFNALATVRQHPAVVAEAIHWVSPEWCLNNAQYFLAKPLAERKELARSVRAESEHAKQVKSMAIMDVSTETVDSVLREHGYPRLIHGHTHRPATHHHVVDSHRCERIVLADWYARGSYLECDQDGCRSVALE